ncbi:TetR/AcrR family transcriptional regulator [Paenibacillus oenotherae]|uniref:TetR/AcrR family transcriptional regulator n=1 Tax=Paenibacillus oenotherae TaxID=1435645 RepID=A0ABS7D7L5_9BACL|nr:TetR/AcrR family transcriptional regulator [Paenibacillus oenotherae]MBW7475870.1 TetR/AcrR family transcriptional regulator [Paenibacillus oenotherae]
MHKNKLSNRDIALQSASTLFLTKGYQVTSMDDIVAHSSVSKTNIYYYFKSKEELLLVIVDRLISQYEQRIHHVLTQEDITTPDKLARLLDILTEEHEQRDYLGGCPFLTLYTQTAGESPAVAAKIQHFFERQFQAVELLLADGIARHEIKGDLPIRQTAALIISSIEGALFIAKASSRPTLFKDLTLALALLLK